MSQFLKWSISLLSIWTFLSIWESLACFLGEKATSQHQRLAKYQRRSASCFFIEWSKVHLVLLHLVSFFAGVHHLRGQIKERVLCVVIWVKSNDFFFFWIIVYPICYQMIWCKEMFMHLGAIHCVNNIEMILPVPVLQVWLIFSILDWKVCFGYAPNLVPLNVECISVSGLHWSLKSYEAIKDICGVSCHTIIKNWVSHWEL